MLRTLCFCLLVTAAARTGSACEQPGFWAKSGLARPARGNMHLNATAVRRGDSIGQGVVIVQIGASGFSTGPHLHFEVLRESIAVDPMASLGPKD